MSDVLGYVLAVIVGVSIGISFAIEGTRDNIVSDCQNFGAFVADDKKYECRLVKP